MFRKPFHNSRPNADADADLARWIEEVDHDTSGFALPRLVAETDYSWLYWEMWQRGLSLRTQVGYTLNKHYGRRVMPDPLKPLPFSFSAVLTEAARQLDLSLMPATAENGLASIAESLMERSGRTEPIWAWMETYPARMVGGVLQPTPPNLIVVLDAPDLAPVRFPDGTMMDVPGWCFAAACVLGKYDHDRAQYSGLVAPGDRILPPDPIRDPSWTPILHIYAKALLGLGRSCPPHSACQCNVVLAILDTPPAAHPQATGSMPVSCGSAGQGGAQ